MSAPEETPPVLAIRAISALNYALQTGGSLSAQLQADVDAAVEALRRMPAGPSLEVVDRNRLEAAANERLAVEAAVRKFKEKIRLSLKPGQPGFRSGYYEACDDLLFLLRERGGQ